MAKQRFRDVKKGNIAEVTPKKEKVKKVKKQNLLKRDYATAGMKIKAYLTDAFMFVMPIMYVVFYLIMDGREEFAQHRTMGWIYILVPLVIIQTIFMFKTSQTPGYRAYNLKLIDDSTGENASLFLIFFRNISAILSMFTLIGWLLMFFRKDHKNLHDLLSGTAVISTI